MVTFLPLELNLTMIILGDTGLHSGNNFSADSLSINATSSRCTCCYYVEYPLSSCKCNLFCFILLAEMLYCHISLATRADPAFLQGAGIPSSNPIPAFQRQRLAFRGLVPDGVIRLETSSGVRPAFAEVICIFSVIVQYPLFSDKPSQHPPWSPLARSRLASSFRGRSREVSMATVSAQGV